MQANRTGLRFSQQVAHFLCTLLKADGECSASTYNILMPNGGRKEENKKCQQCAILKHLMSIQQTSHVCETLLYSLRGKGHFGPNHALWQCRRVGPFPSKSTSLYSLIEGLHPEGRLHDAASTFCHRAAALILELRAVCTTRT